MFGLPYGTPIDMWSFGCILLEFWLGTPIFPGECEHDLVCMIVEYIGPPSVEYLKSAP